MLRSKQKHCEYSARQVVVIHFICALEGAGLISVETVIISFIHHKELATSSASYLLRTSHRRLNIYRPRVWVHNIYIIYIYIYTWHHSEALTARWRRLNNFRFHCYESSSSWNGTMSLTTAGASPHRLAFATRRRANNISTWSHFSASVLTIHVCVDFAWGAFVVNAA